MPDNDNIQDNDDGKWLWDVLYFNPKDKRIFPPKKGGEGYTTNFGNPWSVAALLLILMILLSPIIFRRFLQ